MSFEVWDIPLGPVFGEAGTTTVLTVKPQVRFRVEMVMAQDTGVPQNNGTRVMQFLVGNRLQRPSSGGSTLSAFFGATSLGGRLGWDTCDKGLSIALTVSFVQSCTLDVALFGKATL